MSVSRPGEGGHVLGAQLTHELLRLVRTVIIRLFICNRGAWLLPAAGCQLFCLQGFELSTDQPEDAIDIPTVLLLGSPASSSVPTQPD